MNIFADFVDISKDSRKLFNGLEISKNRDFCEHLMNKMPVVKFSLSNCNEDTFRGSIKSLTKTVWNLYKKHQYLKTSDKLFAKNKEFISAVMARDVDEGTIQNSIDRLVAMITSCYEKR